MPVSTPRIRPYKDFLTPALHRRFARATVTLMGLCYLEAVWVGEWNSLFWSWFPMGRAGIRAILLFIPAFMIFVLRVAQLHVGLRTSNSAYRTFTTYAGRFETLQTAGWYLLSAYLFSEIYIWSASKDNDLNRIKLIPKTDRPMLNERPVYLTCYLLFLAIVQTGFHLFKDYDRIEMPVLKTKPTASSGTNLTVTPTAQMQSKYIGLAWNSLTRAGVMVFISPVIYSLSVRNIAWTFNRAWAKIFWNLPKSSAVPSIRPFHWSLLLKTGMAGFLLTMLWEVANALFSIYVAQEPLKNDRPITYESKDPNGSLLTGLKGKKLQTRAFAFWELVYIAERFQGRRKNIFEDIDRKGGTTWSQILTACLDVITGIDLRITEYQAPAVAVQPTSVEEIPSLPRLGTPIRPGGDIFQTPSKSRSTTDNLIQGVGSLAKNFGQSPPSSVSPKARKLLEKAEGVILTPEQQEAGLGAFFKEKAIIFLKTDVGRPFRQEYRRRIAAIVLGSPYGDVGVIVDAIDALTRLSVNSLSEDKYGNVQRDVKLIIQTLTTTVMKLGQFKNTLGFHWTDVEKKKESPEVDMILTVLKDGLNQLIQNFGDYSEDLRLSQNDMRMAREAVTPARTQMQQTVR